MDPRKDITTSSDLSLQVNRTVIQSAVLDLREVPVDLNSKDIQQTQD